MATPQSITVYKGDRSIDIEPAAWEEAKAKGWSKDKPAPQPQPQAQPQAQPPAQPQATPGAQKQGFMRSFGQGINPFHSAPAGTPDLPGTKGEGGGWRAIDDLINSREIADKVKQGNYGDAAGMTAGTIASFAGPELVKAGGKALKGAGEAVRGAREVPMLNNAAKRAVNFAKELRVTPDVARYVERFVEPLHAALDKKWEPVHQAMQGKIIPLNNSVMRTIRRLSTTESPSLGKLAEELSGRTALDYREAEGLRRQLTEMAGKEAEQWAPILKDMAKEIDQLVQKEANTVGIGPLREELQGLYKQTRSLARAAASTAKTKQGALRGAMYAGAAAADHVGLTGVGGSMRSVTETVTKIAPEVKAVAEKLAKKLGVDPKLLENSLTPLERGGKAITNTGRAAQAANVGGRVATSVMSDHSMPLVPSH